MKKIALAVSAALLAGSAMAADVTLYGRIDTGFSYTNTRTNSFGEKSSAKSFSMDSGNSTGSRWGLKGTEDLGNGYKVGFVLESKFWSDSGKSESRLFHRESSLFVSGGFGTVYAGRLTSITGDSGSIGWYGGMASPFGSGWGAIAGHNEVISMQFGKDNTLAYVSPRFAGVQVSAQYSMGEDSKENKPSTDRYAAVGVDYQAGNLEVGAVVDYMNRNSADIDSDKLEDAWTFNLAANYDFDVVKVYAAAQYVKDNPTLGRWSYAPTGASEAEKLEFHRHVAFDGFGVNLGADMPLLGGNLLASIGYADGKGEYDKVKELDAKAYTALVGYTYPFSKRTSVYAGAGWTRVKHDYNDHANRAGTVKVDTYQAMAGLVHKF